MKKGDLSINVVVMAAIGMLILVILTVFVFRSTGGLDSSTTCDGFADNIDASCISATECRNDGGIVNSAARCNTGDSSAVCCLKRLD